MSDWVPTLSASRGPRYSAIVDALADDIQAGRVTPGTRLLPQRDLAERLGLSVGTVSKAYSEAEQRGLVSGKVGRGTFVRGKRLPVSPVEATGSGAINLALNVPPATGAEQLIAETLAEIASDGSLPSLMGYLPHQGLRTHREAIASWLADMGLKAEPDLVLITHGAQHALSIAASMVSSSGSAVLAEGRTYSGMVALAAQAGLALTGVAMDDAGLQPAALDRAFAETGAKLLYCMPSLHTPTGITMPEARREQIADIVSKHDAFVLEDDAYAFLFDVPPRPLSALIPQRSFYVASFAKCLAPGLRIGAMAIPEIFRDRCINALRATGWMATPVMAEIVARLLRNGGLAAQALAKREKAAVRQAMARQTLKEWLGPEPAVPGFHIWLRLPAGRTLNSLITQASHAGITIAPPNALLPSRPGDVGVRLCLGAPSSEDQLGSALGRLRDILEQAEAISLV